MSHSNMTTPGTNVTEGGFQRPTAVLVIQLFILAINTFLAVAGNILLVVTVYNRPLLKRVTYYLVSTLAVDDLLASVTYASFYPQAFIIGDWVIGHAACGAYAYLSFIFGLVELYLMATISVDRYIACCNPLRYSSIVTPLRCKFVIGVLLVASFILTNVAIFECEVYGYDSYTNLCGIDFSRGSKHYICSASIFCLSSLPCSLTMGICQYKILKQVRKVTHNAPPNMASSGCGSTSGNSGFNKATITVSLLTGTYIVAWLPLLFVRTSHVFVDWDASALSKQAISILREVTFHIYMVSKFVNPVIYGIYNQEFREECEKLFKKSR